MFIVQGQELKLDNSSNRFSDEELFQFCQINANWRVERDAQQNIVITPPIAGISGIREKDLNFELERWRRRHGKGMTFSSSTGFLLPNGAMRSPDASYMNPERYDALTPGDLQKFVPAVPHFIAEIRSPSDHMKDLKEKMVEWIQNGVQLGWLIDAEGKQVTVYRHGREAQTIDGLHQTLSGESVLPGFEFNLGQF